MYEPNPAGGNRFLYHWLSPERLGRFAGRGTLNPYWRHWVYDLGGFTKGISASPNPVDWMPRESEGTPGEPCLVIDRTAFKHQSIELYSAESYHLTREIVAAIRKGRDIGGLLERVPGRRRTIYAAFDETFIITPIPSSAVAAIGFEPNRMYWEDLEIITSTAEQWRVPLVRMDGWLENPPDTDELDAIIERAIENPNDRRYY